MLAVMARMEDAQSGALSSSDERDAVETDPESFVGILFVVKKTFQSLSRGESPGPLVKEVVLLDMVLFMYFSCGVVKLLLLSKLLEQ